MKLNTLIRSHIKATMSVKLANANIRSQRDNGVFSFTLSSAEICQKKDGSFYVKAEILKADAATVTASQELTHKENKNRIDREDSLHLEGTTASGIKTAARIFWVNVKTPCDSMATICELSADLKEIEFVEQARSTSQEHNTYIIYKIKKRALPCDKRNDLPEQFRLILKSDWAGNNTHVIRGEHDVISFRDNTHQIIALEAQSINQAHELRHNIDTCLSFLLGQMHESLGLIYFEGQQALFVPLSPAPHEVAYPQPISTPGPHYEPFSAAFWDAFSKILKKLKSLSPDHTADLRRAIKKPLQLPEGGLFELRVMLLAISVETLADTVIPEDLAAYHPPEGAQQVIEHVSKLEINKETLRRAKDLLNKMLSPSAPNALKAYAKRMKLEKVLSGSWSSVRGRLVHGKGLDYENIDKVMGDYDQILMLHNSIILSSSGYTGPIANHLRLGKNLNLMLDSEGISAVGADPLKNLECIHYEKTAQGRFSPINDRV